MRARQHRSTDELEPAIADEAIGIAVATPMPTRVSSGRRQEDAEAGRRQAHLALLAEVTGECLRLSSPDEIMQVVGARIGAYFRVSLCLFVDIDEARDEATLAPAWRAPGLPELPRAVRISDYVTEAFLHAARAGETLVVHDVRADPRTRDGVREGPRPHAYISVPFHRDGEWRFLMVIADIRAARHWRTDEVMLVRDLANRIFPCVERARVEQALRESERKYRTLFESITDGYCVGDVIFGENGRAVDIAYLDANPAATRLTGVELAGRRLSELYPEYQAKWTELFGKVAIDGEPRRMELFAGALSTWLELDVFKVGGAQSRRVAMFFKDVSARKQAEAALYELNATLEARVDARTAELVESERQLRRATSLLTMAEQEERSRISQVLHDDLQQQLHSVQMKLGMARQQAGRGNVEKAMQSMAEAESWITQAVQITRQLTVDLSPPILKSEGLAEALAWLVTQMREKHDLEVTLVADDHPRLPEPMRVLIFQIVRELLFNVIKHAGVDRAVVDLRGDADGVIVTVRDEGRGFEHEVAAKRMWHAGGFGLPSVRERLALFGGRMEIESAPGAGTCVALWLPVRVQP
jgi:PAS domain S-box-containing protein